MALTTYSFTSMTSGAANTKGAYVQVVASTPYDSSRVHLNVLQGAAAQRFFLFDLATGGAGAETVVVANIAIALDNDGLAGQCVSMDVDVPAGTRLAVRAQAVTASSALSVGVVLENRALAGLATPVTYGTDTATSSGTVIDPGGTINTKSSYVPFSASTSARIDALALCFTPDAQTTALTAFTGWTVDVATGAAGAESVVIADLVVFGNAQNDGKGQPIMRFPVSIPAGTRLAVRAACDRNTAGQRLIRVTLIGMQEPATTSGGGMTSVAFVG